MEQLNIVGKRSGEGFVAHKAMLVIALARAIADRVVLMGVTLGRKGFIGYLKALGGSNIVKVIPSNGSASGKQATIKGLKVICGANTSQIPDSHWVKEANDKGKGGTPLTFCDVRVSPSNSLMPNVGAIELAEALARVLPFTATDDARPVLQCVLFHAKDGKLTIVSADGFRLAIVRLDYPESETGLVVGEGVARINADSLKGVANALRKAKRVRVSFESGDVGKPLNLVIDTELIRYKWADTEASYPEYEKLIPTEFNIFAHFDTIEAIKAVNSLKAVADSKAYPIDLTIGDGKLVMANTDNKGQAELVADTEGEGTIRLDGQYLAEALKACGGMVELKLTNSLSPMLFSANGYQLVVMPMLTAEAQELAKAVRKVKPIEDWTEADEQSFRQREHDLAEKAKDHAPTEAEQAERVELVALAVRRKQFLSPADFKRLNAKAKAEQAEPVAEPVAVAPVAEPKQAKRSRAKQPVA